MALQPPSYHSVVNAQENRYQFGQQSNGHLNPVGGRSAFNLSYETDPSQEKRPPKLSDLSDVTVQNELDTHIPSGHSREANASISALSLASNSSAAKMPLPVVLPQTSKSFRGAFFSPFVRAYAPQLELHGIDQSTFLTCIDGLNEAFVSHPLFQVAGGMGNLMGIFGGALPPVQWAGMGLQLVSGLSSAATSYGRTKLYVKAVNEDLFHPAGLHMGIASTKAMMESVGCPQDTLTLPPLNTNKDVENLKTVEGEEGILGTSQSQLNDPRMRRIEALQGYVLPLDMDVPATVSPENFLRRMGNFQAQKFSQKQEKKLNESREKGYKEYDKKSRHAAKAKEKGEKEVNKVLRELEKLEVNTNAKSNSKKALSDPKEQEKIRREHDKEVNKLHKEMDKKSREMEHEVAKHQKDADKGINKVDKKEQKTASSIRWVVISQWDSVSESGDVSAEESCET